MKRYELRRVTVATETEESLLEMADDEEILSVDSGLVAGHPTYTFVLGRLLPRSTRTWVK